MSANENQIATCDSNDAVSEDAIRTMIVPVRGVQVMLDRDLAALYGVEVKYLNRQVKRNIERFPADFMFQLTKEDCLRCQIGTINGKRGEHRKYMPYAFTENGIAMLSGVLRSSTAIGINIRIMRAFVAMRRVLANVEPLLSRIESVERRQITDQSKNEARFAQIFSELGKLEIPVQGVFYDGQLWDARALVMKLVQSAKRSLILIDNWATPETLDLFTKKRKGVKVTIFTSEHYDKKHVPHRKISDADIKTFNAQYPKLAVRYNESFHDRFLIIDDKEIYLVGASLKDLGAKCFAFTQLDSNAIRGIKKSAFASLAKSS